LDTLLCKLHQDAELVIVKEGVEVPDDVGVVELDELGFALAEIKAVLA